MRIAVFGRERLEGGLEELHVVALSADHQAVAVRETPDPARDTRVDVADPVLGGHRGTTLRVPEVRVATVDDDVGLLEEADELLDRLLSRIAGRDHQPD